MESCSLIENMNHMSIIENMKKERISLTCAPGGENHRGNQLIGRMPIKGEGFTANDLDEGLTPHFTELMGNERAEIVDLNAYSLEKKINDLEDIDQARVLLLRRWVQYNFGDVATKYIYCEMKDDNWDSKFLDPNKYRTELVDGVEVRKRGRVLNKHARHNICYVDGMNQEANYLEGMGTIIDLKTKTQLFLAVETLKKQIADGLLKINSKTKVIINVVEGNRYYDVKKTGIGFHGDTERVVVICISIGGSEYPMRWQWFKDRMPVGEPIDIELNDGDVYIMSEKAVGSDWKKGIPFTLRHSAGAEKYRTLKKWTKRAADKAEKKKK